METSRTTNQSRPDSKRGELRRCTVCGTEFTARHSKHTTCGNDECTRAHNRKAMSDWKLKTGRSNGPKENLWSAEELNFLKTNRFTSSKEIAIQLGRSVMSVKEKRSRNEWHHLAVCKSCGQEFKRVNQHDVCLDCVPTQQGYEKAYRNGLNGRWQMYKSNATKRGIPFNLTITQFADLWGKDCHYCGSQIEYIGVDRLDSGIGYEPTNVIPCCARCNEMKNNASVSDWLAQMKKVIAHMESK